MTDHTTVPDPGSPFELFEPSLALSLGLALSLLGASVLFIAVSPLSDMLSSRQLALLVGLAAASVAGSGSLDIPRLHAVWTVLGLVYAFGVPVLVTLVGLRGLVTDRNSTGSG